MNVASFETLLYSETDVKAAILAIKNKQYSSIRKAAAAFNIPYPTLRGRMSGRKSRSIAHEAEQILSAAEEKTLWQWITRSYTRRISCVPCFGD